MVKHMSRSCVVTIPESASKRRTVIEFIFSRPESLDPSIAMENGPDDIALTRADLKCGARDPLTMQLVFVRADT